MRQRTGFSAVLLVGSMGLAACGEAQPDSTDPMDRLARAVAVLDATSRYEIRTFTASHMEFSQLGVDVTTEMDDDHPVSVVEVADGNSHATVDLSAMFPVVEAGIGFEIWSDPHRMVIDTRSFETLAAAGAELGVFRPGVAEVDLDRLGAESADVVSAVAGEVVDLRALAQRLPDALDELEQTSSSPVTLTGKALWSDLMEAQGGDVEGAARSAAAGIALNLAVDATVLADIYADLYRSSSADVTLVFAPDGTIASLEQRADMSSFWEDFIERGTELGLPSTLIAQGANAAHRATMTVAARSEFRLRDDLTLPQPPAADEDRTDEWMAFLRTVAG